MPCYPAGDTVRQAVECTTLARHSARVQRDNGFYRAQKVTHELEGFEIPHGVYISGLESNGGDQFFYGGGKSGKVKGGGDPDKVMTPPDFSICPK